MCFEFIPAAILFICVSPWSIQKEIILKCFNKFMQGYLFIKYFNETAIHIWNIENLLEINYL